MCNCAELLICLGESSMLGFSGVRTCMYYELLNMSISGSTVSS